MKSILSPVLSSPVLLRVRRLALALAACCTFPALWAQAADSASLAARIDSLVLNGLPEGSEAGICLYDLTDSKPLYAYRADKLSRPASTMKLLTSITALSLPGASEPFRTEVWAQGEVANDTLRGDLYVVGGFDPEFNEEALDSLARTVARAPFHVIDGHILGDVSLKDSLYWGSGWMWDDNPAAFQPYLSTLMLQKGTLTVKATPGIKGDTAALECIPASTYYTVVNETRTRTPSAGRFKVTRNWLEGGNLVTVTGNVDTRCAGIINIAGSERYFMHTFAERLKQNGIGCTTAGYGFGEWMEDSLSTRLAEWQTPMPAVLVRMMKKSDNLNAEAMLWRIGLQTTGKRHINARDGLKAVYAMIKEAGCDPDSYKLADGCGLSHYDYISPELEVAFLRYAHSRTDIFQMLYKSLPTAGVDGTLRGRMRKGSAAYRKVFAKTGSYTGINCLAGYIYTRSNHWIAFSVMNQNVLSARKARAFQDAVCEAAAAY